MGARVLVLRPAGGSGLTRLAGVAAERLDVVAGIRCERFVLRMAAARTQGRLIVGPLKRGFDVLVEPLGFAGGDYSSKEDAARDPS